MTWSRLVTALAAAGLAYAAGAASFYFLGRYPRHRVETAWIAAGVLLVLAQLRNVRHADRNGGAVPRAPGPWWLFVAAAVLLYLPSFTVGRLADDFVLLGASARWDLLPAAWEHKRPLPLGIWAALTAIGLSSPVILHAVNIVLHGVNASLVHRLGGAIGISGRGRLAAGALFLAFPGAVEAVTWISDLQSVLMTSCVLGFLLAALSGRTAIAILLLVAATLSKETAVCAPVLLVLMLTFRRVPPRLMAVAFAWVLLFAIARLMVSPPAGAFDLPGRYQLKEFVSRLFANLSMPWTMTQIASFPYFALGSLGAITLVLLRSVTARLTPRQSRAALVLVAWCLAAVAPLFLYLYVGPDLQGSRYLYLPSAAWFLLIALVASAGEQGRLESRVMTAALALLLALGVTGTVMQQFRWRAASTFRDEVLVAASEAARANGCAAPFFASGPAARDGVHVFINGLNEAFSETWPAAEGAAADCRFEWDGARLVRR